MPALPRPCPYPLPRLQWQHSYVTDGKTFCIYLAVDEEAIREHASHGGCDAEAVCTMQCNAAACRALKGQASRQMSYNNHKTVRRGVRHGRWG